MDLQTCFICKKSFVICHESLVSASVTFDKAYIPSTAPRAKILNLGVLVNALAVNVFQILPSNFANKIRSITFLGSFVRIELFYFCLYVLHYKEHVLRI